MDGLTLTPPENSDEDFTLSVTALSTGIDGSIAESTESINITVNAVIEGTDADDVLEGGAERETLYGLGGNDTLKGGEGNDTLYGGVGDDILFGGDGEDTLNGGSGNDELLGLAGNDLYLFEAGFGQDILYDNDGNNVIKFGAGISPEQIQVSRDRYDVILKIVGTSDQLTINNFFSSTSDAQIDRIEFVDGTIWSEDDLLSILNTPTSEDDWITGTDGDDVIDGLAGDDIIQASSGNDILYGGLGDDVLDGSMDNDELHGGDGQDSLQGGWGDDVLYGEGGHDYLYGGGGNDILSGGDGDEFLAGEDGDDDLTGGAGNDRLEGLTGNDSYHFGRGSGQDTLYDSWGDADILFIDDGVAPDEINIVRTGSTITLEIIGTDDRLTIEDWFDDLRKIEKFVFSDGTVWTPEQIEPLLVSTQVGTEEADTLTGVEGKNNDISGLGGDDNLTGFYRGDDVLDGGEGNDVLNWTGGSDILIGGEGSDRITYDRTNRWLFNASANVTIVGGPGNDEFIGSFGNTTYEYSSGDGWDSIIDLYGQDVLKFSEGISPDDIRLGLEDRNLYIYLPSAEDRILIRLWEGGRYIVYTDYNKNISYYTDDTFAVDIQFADGTYWNEQTIKQLATGIISGTSGNDTLYATDDTKVVEGLEGNDTLIGSGTSDQLRGGSGNDSLRGLEGADVLDGGEGTDIAYYLSSTEGVQIDLTTGLGFGGEAEGDTLKDVENVQGSRYDDVLTGDEANNLLLGYEGADQLQGGAGNDTLRGGEGADVLYGSAGEDILEGEAGNDILDGGQGNDSLSGGEGNDCYLFTTGSGEDQIWDSEAYSEGSNIVRFSSEIFPENVAVCQQDTDLFLILRNSGDQLVIKNWFTQEQSQAFQIEFSDGTLWNADDLNTKASLGATNTPPELTNELLDQEVAQNSNLNYQVPTDSFNDPDAGDNLIYSASLEDGGSLPSWLSFDTSTGLFNGIPDYIDIGVLNIKVTATDMYGARISDVFSLTVNSANQAPTVSGSVSLGSLQEDGSLLIASAALLENASDSNDDNLTVSALTVDTGSAVDKGDGTWIYQPNANAYGSVTFSYLVSDGFESVAATANLDVIAVNDAPLIGAALIDQTISRGSAFSYQLPTGSFTDPDQSDSLSYSVFLEDGSVLPTWLTFDPVTASFSGTPSRDDVGTLSIKVTASDSEGLSVSDSFSLIVEVPVVSGSDASETLVGTNNDEIIIGYSGDDQLFGFNGADDLDGGDGADYLDGGSGDDIQLGGAGNDQLGGDAGNDMLIGGTGDDIYVYRPGSGADTINNSDGGADWLIFTDDLTSDRLSYIQSDDDLIIRIDNTATSQVTITGWFVSSDNQLTYIQPAGQSGIAAATINALFEDYSGGDDSTGEGSGTEIPPQGAFDAVVEGTESAEQVVGTAGADLLQALAGDDQLFGLSGDDWLVAGDGADYLDGGAGDDVQFGDAGDDQLGGDAGNDTLIGGAGNDIYVYRPGSGADTIDNSGGGTDWLIFTDDITEERLSYHRFGDDLQVKLDGDEATMATVKHWFDGDDYKLSYIQPSGGYGISAASIENMLSSAPDSGFDALLTGTDNSDILTGSSTADQLCGYDGEDQLFGLAGNDELSGDDGDDILYGGAGDDIYLFDLGDGRDTLSDASGVDMVVFGDEVTAENFALFMNGTTLHIGYGVDDQIILAEYSDSDIGNRIEDFILADGSYLADSDVSQIIQDMSAYASVEGLNLTSLEDVRQNEGLLAITANAWEAA